MRWIDCLEYHHRQGQVHCGTNGACGRQSRVDCEDGAGLSGRYSGSVRQLRNILTASFILAIPLLPASAREDPPQTEEITLTVEVLTETDAPVPGVPLRVDSSVRMHFGITDEDGKLTLDITRQVGEDLLAARPSSGLFLWENDDQKEEAIERFHIVRKQYSFDQTTFIQLDGEGPTYSGIVRAYDAVTITGRFVDADGEPIEGSLGAPPQLCYGFADADGVFELGGVRQGVPAEIVYGIGATEVHSISLTPQQLTINLDLGDVSVVDTPTDATISIRMTGLENVGPRDLISILNGVSLLSSDGDACHTSQASSSGIVFYFDEGNAVTMIPIPSGTWFVTPGSVGKVPWQMLRQALRDGKAAELEAAGVPKIVVPPGEHVEFTFSAVDAWNALKSVVPEP